MPLSITTTSSNVFDLSLMRDKSLPLKTALFSKPSNVDSCPLSVDTTVAASDDSSISTIGSTTSELQAKAFSNNSKRRSLFPKYWNKTGASPSITMLRKQSPYTPLLETFHVSDDSESSEHSVPATEEQVSKPLSHAATPLRRTLFSNEALRCSSLSCLPSCRLETPNRRKSAAELGQNAKSPVSSCLREPRFSGSRRSICSESSVVQFDMESTEIRHYVQPREVHAEKGWTEFFH